MYTPGCRFLKACPAVPVFGLAVNITLPVPWVAHSGTAAAASPPLARPCGPCTGLRAPPGLRRAARRRATPRRHGQRP